VKVAIIGGGAAGIAMAIALERAGHEYVLFERSAALGGTWHDNVYPGAGCDVPSHLYCYSFAPNDWERKFALQPEIRRYLLRIADQHSVPSHVRLDTEVKAARFRDGVWHLETSGGEVIADVVVSGSGQLNRPHTPSLPGAREFRGAHFHSARWDPGFDPAGKSIVVVGCGASAIQFVPQIAPLARQVTILQRSPPYVIPRKDRAFRGWERWMLRHVPLWRRWYRAWIYWSLEARFGVLRTGSWMAKLVRWMALRNLRAAIPDAALRAKLTPDYAVGCKRILISDDWYPTLARSNVHVATAPIDRVTGDGVLTADGVAHAADALIYATGFESTQFLAPMQITGKHGTTLAETWRHGAEAHRGIAVAGFPNLFLLYGPNTNLGHNSILFMLECQVRYIVRCLDGLARRGARWLDVRAEAMARYNETLQRALARTPWGTGCHNWYTTDGKITNNWSSRTVRYWWQNRRPDFREYDFG
jgi:cation diffusion facilitator CzcD-associated flavoprotein CzcO